MFSQVGAAPHHETQMGLSHFIVGEVERLETFTGEHFGQFFAFCGRTDLEAHENMGALGIGNTVIELGHAARTDGFAQFQEAAALFRNRERQQRFARLADVGPVGNKTQAIKVHVGAAGYGHQIFVLPFI